MYGAIFTKQDVYLFLTFRTYFVMITNLNTYTLFVLNVQYYKHCIPLHNICTIINTIFIAFKM